MVETTDIYPSNIKADYKIENVIGKQVLNKSNCAEAALLKCVRAGVERPEIM